MSKKTSEEIQEIINIIHSYNIEQQDIFIYNTLFKNDVDEIASMFKMDKTFVSLELKRLQKALYNANHKNPKLWEKAMHDYMWEKIRINTKSTLNKLEQIATPFDFPADTENLLFNSELPKKSKKDKILIWLKRYASVAVFVLSFFTLSAGTGYAMVKLGIIQIHYEKSSDVYVSTADKKQLKTIETLYLPEYLPNGYTFTEQNGTLYEDSFIKTTYMKSNFELTLHQNVENIVIDIDNENGISRDVKINESQGIFKEIDSTKMLTWAEGNYFYSLYSYDPEMDEYKIIKIAESVKEITNEKN